MLNVERFEFPPKAEDAIFRVIVYDRFQKPHI
jgi:hypothetical protein